MSNPRRLSRPTLAVFAKSAAKAIADGKITELTPEQNLAMSAALDAEADLLAEADEKAVASAAQARTDTAIANDRQRKVVEMLSAYKFALRGLRAPASEYEALGFDPPADPANVTMPETPTKLRATGFSNGVNKLKYQGNNGANAVSFVLEANKGDGWFMIGTTRNQSFKHEGVTPGQGCQYRVRAQATRGLTSAWSNTASVYDLKKEP